MPTANNAANVAVVTGYVDKGFAEKELYELGMFLKKDPFWNAQIQQINVTATKELEFVPRVGDHIIFIGKPGNYEKKFDRLKIFYKKGLNEVGWNKYSRISLEFENQIICTKKEK
jgi:cell division protein FtsQ